MIKKWFHLWWPILPSICLFAYLANDLNFTQDDAFISYRYVANYLNGDGLVFNIGERIEGFTNFGWVLYLIGWGGLGFDIVRVSTVTGFLFGITYLILSYLIALRLFDNNRWLAGLVSVIVASNMSLAYWAPAGLETAAFSTMVLLSFYLYMKRSFWLLWSLTLLVLLRPEGALIAGILIVLETIEQRRIPRFTVTCAIAAFVFSLPYVGFKLFYYGSILPNPFYAKTGASLDQVFTGLEYVWLFMSHYGFYGVPLVAAIFLYSRMSATCRSVLWITVIYTGYVVIVGGDVLEVHRFFIPLIGMYAAITICTLDMLSASLKGWMKPVALSVVAVGLVGLTIYLPYDHIRQYQRAGIGLNDKMSFLANQLQQIDDSEFSVALPTIGVFGYELVGHDIIDMVGLTDTVISRHPQAAIEGMTSDWREPAYNTPYLLEREPDYVLFSTGIKPTAPGEKALLMYREFVDNYRTIGFSYRRDPSKSTSVLSSVFRRTGPIGEVGSPSYSIAYVDLFKRGIDAYLARRHREAIALFDSAIAVRPRADNPYLYYRKGLSLLMLGKHEIAMAEFDRLLARDSTIFEAHKDLHLYAVVTGNSSKAATHERWIKKLTPWYWSRQAEIAQREVERINQLESKQR